MDSNAQQQPEQTVSSQLIQEQAPKDITKKSPISKIILAILGIMIILGVASAAYYLGATKASPKNVANNSNDKVVGLTPIGNSQQNITSNWQTYTNQEYGYQIKVPFNWFTSTQLESQSFSPSKSYGACGGSTPGIFVSVLDNPTKMSAIDFVKNEISKLQGFPIKVFTDRMGFSKDLDVVITDGYPGAGSPGPQADINTGSGKIIEVRTEPSYYSSETLHTIFSTFKLVTSTPNAQDVSVDISPKNNNYPGLGDVEVLKGGTKKVITNWGHNQSPVLSPDKTKIAYISETQQYVSAKDKGDYSQQASTNIWIINTDGTNPIQVTNYIPNKLRMNIHWLDNDRLIYQEGSNIMVYSIKTKSTQQLTSLNARSDHYTFAYNSNGTYLIGVDNNEGTNPPAPFVIINLTTLQVLTLSDEVLPLECDIKFGPDNTTFIGTNKNGQLATVDLKTGRVTYGGKVTAKDYQSN